MTWLAIVKRDGPDHAQSVNTRRPRFIRTSHGLNVQLLDRDLNIFEHLVRFRLLTREQIHRLEFPGRGETGCKRRLGQLYHAGYVGRIPLPLRNAYGATRAVYYLERSGQRALQLARGYPRLPTRKADAEREELFLRHTVDVSEVGVAFAVAANGHRLRLDWWPESRLRRERRGTTSLLPDAYFALKSHIGVDGFALEVDRGTVSERRMRARFRAYGEWATSGAYLKAFPHRSFRVLIVVTRERQAARRLAQLKAWCEAEGGGSLFWFIGRDAITAGDVLTEASWLVAGEEGTKSLPLT